MNLAYAKRSEDTEQIAVMQWADWNIRKYPELRWLHHCANGGSRNKQEAVKFKQMGVRKGVSDLHLPYAKGKYIGLYIEMKYGKNTVTAEQIEFLQEMNDAGHYTVVAHSSESAIEILIRYLELEQGQEIDERTLTAKNIKKDRHNLLHVG